MSSLQPHARSLLRIVAGFCFSLHGFQKLLGFFGGMGGKGALASFPTVVWFAGFLELVGGLLLLLGLFTRPTAFILSGQMAVAYFMAHFPRGFLPISNGGELAALYSFLFLYYSFAGPGPVSLDALVRKKA
jgi:putative oxidoreductase